MTKESPQPGVPCRARQEQHTLLPPLIPLPHRESLEELIKPEIMEHHRMFARAASASDPKVMNTFEESCLRSCLPKMRAEPTGADPPVVLSSWDDVLLLSSGKPGKNLSCTTGMGILPSISVIQNCWIVLHRESLCDVVPACPYIAPGLHLHAMILWGCF